MGYSDGDYIYDTHWKAMQEAIKGNGIYTGFAGSAPGGMTCRLAAGTYWAKVTEVIKAGNTDKTITNGDASYDRWDLISGKSDGTITLTNGIASVSPGPPNLPADEIILAMVYVPAGTTVLLVGMIYDFGFTSTWMNHHSRHENGADDEMSVAGLSGLLADVQTPAAHKINHQVGGSDEINLTNLTGLSATPQTPAGHHAVHEDGGGDVVDLTALSGLCKDAQTPLGHAHAYHTDRTRYRNIDIFAAFCNPAYTIVKNAFAVGGGGTSYNGVEFTKAGYAAGTTIINMIVEVPAGMTALTTASIDLLWAVDSAAGAADYIHTRIGVHDVGDAFLGSRETIDSVPSCQNMDTYPIRVGYSLAAMTFVANTMFLQIDVDRFGASGSDTFAGDAWLVGARLKYTADM